MTPEISVLLWTAAVVGATHTAIGVDHSLPFIMLGRARRWTLTKTLGVTTMCGVGHVLSSVVIGVVGYFGLGFTVNHLLDIEGVRGHWAAWLLIAFGITYAVLGLWRLSRGDAHRHFHVHSDGTIHAHDHRHGTSDGQVMHHHAHGARAPLPLSSKKLLPALFVIFVLGPCEALIPLMAAPALAGSGAFAPLSIAGVFGLATVGTMLMLVALGYWGLSVTTLGRIEKHMQWVAGMAIALSGISVEFLGV